MNRNDEYNELSKNLEDTPYALDYTVTRAQAKVRSAKKRRTRAIFIPTGSLVMLFAVFTILVNVSPTFAYAAGRIPLIGDLARAVTYSPSLSAAIENQYVQPMELEQTKDGITARIEYVIVDQKQLNIFYTLDSEVYFEMDATPNLFTTDHSHLACCISSDHNGGENGTLKRFEADLSDGEFPSDLLLTMKVHDNGPDGYKQYPINDPSDGEIGVYENKEPDYIATFEFTLSIDPYYTAQGETIDLNHEFTMDGQRLVLENAEIYPTHMRFNFSDFPENTAWLQSLEFYVENEKGEQFEGITNGISASGCADSPMMASHRLESAFFSKSKHLTLRITGVTWLDKDMETVHVDLENKTVEKLPDGVRFELAKKMKNGWMLEFSAPEIKESHQYQLFRWGYSGIDGKEYDFENGMSSWGGIDYYDELTGKTVDMTGRFIESFALLNYHENEVYLKPIFSKRVTLDKPVSIEIK